MCWTSFLVRQGINGGHDSWPDRRAKGQGFVRPEHPALCCSRCSSMEKFELHGRPGFRGLRLADVQRAVPCHVRVDEIHGDTSPLHPFDFTAFAADYTHFFQCAHDGADMLGGTSDPFGELVAGEQDFACVLPKIKQH